MNPAVTDVLLPATDADLSGPAWDEAFLRVESYLRAHQIESRLVLNRLTVEIIRAARAKALEHKAANRGTVDPVAVAMGEAERRTTAWFARVLGDAADPDDERLGTRGRIALVMADVPARWPRDFFADTPPPPELVEAMRAAYIEAGPELELTRMVPRPFDFGPIANVADEAWKTFARWPVLRAIFGWLVFLGLLAGAWFATH
ncbi:MAG: hypothetical protein MUE42_01820 [Opitutaceae bacterium]|jgi:hypothetical protein|nr:hypothetical protein [Opitutaceae bacterium]